MDQSKKIQVVAILALLIATMSLLVGFSSLNAQLDYAGNQGIKNANWNVHFGGIANVHSSNEAYAAFSVVPKVNVDNELLINYGVAFYQPNETLTFEFNVLNEGNVDARVNDIIITGLEGMESLVTYSISGIAVGDVVTAHDAINSVTVTLTSNPVYDANFMYQPVNISNIGLRVGFVQDKK